MTLLAYIDARPYLFLGGLLVFILLAILICRRIGVKLRKTRVAAIASLVFTGLFVFFLTGFGPFIGQTETREYQMTWEIQPPPSKELTQSVVVLSFAEFPGHFVSHHSDELAGHLQAVGEDKVTVIFEIARDYGRMKGYSEIEIAGLKTWSSQLSSGGTRGDPKKSPWD